MVLEVKCVGVWLQDKHNSTPLNDAVRHHQDQVAQHLRTQYPELQ